MPWGSSEAKRIADMALGWTATPADSTNGAADVGIAMRGASPDICEVDI